MSYLLIACRTLLLGVFLAALAGKVRRRAAYRDFVASLRALGVLPGRLVAVTAAAVTAAEAAIVVLLAVPGTVPAGFLLTAVLLTAFTTGIVVAVRRGTTAPCACFGASVTPLGRVHVVRNLVLLGTAGAGLAVAGAGGGGGEFAGAALAVAAAVVALVPVLRLDDLAALFSRAPARES
ncbi:methylamine utilization protein MauE [Amycolatopsis sp. H6(2020)]|nr:methylamine utilization protein MauE [Amycolatopsis sp. H6(2020)]